MGFTINIESMKFTSYKFSLFFPFLVILILTYSALNFMFPIVIYSPSNPQNARPPLPSSCPTAFRHLIRRCWSSNPDKRPQFDEIVSRLESYSESLEQDPEFFSSYEPPEGCTLFRCISRRSSARRLKGPQKPV